MTTLLLTLVLGGLSVVVGGVLAYFWTKKHPEWGAKKVEQKPQQPGVKVQAGVVATLLAVALVWFQMPSISIDLSSIFSYSSQIVNMMMPILGVGAGISFGFSLVAYIMRLFKNIF